MAGKGLRHPYLEPPGWLSRAPGKGGFHRRHLGQQPFTLLIIPATLRRHAELAGGALEKLRPEPGFQLLHHPRYRGARLPEHLRRAGEAVGIHDRNIDLHGIQFVHFVTSPSAHYPIITNSLTRNAVLIECRPSPYTEPVARPYKT